MTDDDKRAEASQGSVVCEGVPKELDLQEDGYTWLTCTVKFHDNGSLWIGNPPTGHS